MQRMILCDSGESITHDRNNHVKGTNWREESSQDEDQVAHHWLCAFFIGIDLQECSLGKQVLVQQSVEQPESRVVASNLIRMLSIEDVHCGSKHTQEDGEDHEEWQ